MNISIKDAKDLLEDLVRRAEAGEHVVLTRDGKPVAEDRAFHCNRPGTSSFTRRYERSDPDGG